MKFRNETSIAGLTQFHVVGLNEKRGKIGIHRIGPIKQLDIEDAMQTAYRDGFTAIYIHTTSPTNVKKLIRKILKHYQE